MTYHVRKGERLLLYSRFRDVGSTGTPVDIEGSVKVLYDNDEGFDYRNVGAIPIPATGTAITQSDVATFLAEPFRHDGEIVDARLWGSILAGNASVQRGQVAATLGVWYRGLANPAFRLELCRGYLWAGRPSFGLGELEVLGPSGGAGTFLPNPVVPSTAIGADFIMDLTTPANTIRRVHELRIRFASSATVGTRTVRLSRLDEDAASLYQLGADQAPAANQTTDFILTDILAAERAGVGATGTSEVQTRPFWLPEGHILRVFDAASIDANDTVTMFGIVEEWLLL